MNMTFTCGVIPSWTLEGAEDTLFKLKGGQRSNVSPEMPWLCLKWNSNVLNNMQYIFMLLSI